MELIDYTKLIDIFEERARGIEQAYLKRIGAHLRSIGQLSPSDVHALIEMRRLDRNLRSILLELQKASQLNAQQVQSAFYTLAVENYEYAAALLGISDPPPFQQNQHLMQLVRAQSAVTAGEMYNLSRTTIESGLYRRSVDTAIQAVQMGMTDYNSATRMAAARAAQQGLVVTYPSGYHRRLDSAVRQNVIDGVRYLNQAVLDEVGREFGATGVELSAHAMCAPDHLPYQGRQYSLEQFQQLQAKLEASKKGRRIGQWNCRHIARPIMLGISKPAYSEETLQQFAQNSNKQIEIGGKRLSRYEWTQEQRAIETQIRKQRDVITMAQAREDTDAERSARDAIRALEARYNVISKAAGLETQFGRTLARTRRSYT